MGRVCAPRFTIPIPFQFKWRSEVGGGGHFDTVATRNPVPLLHIHAGTTMGEHPSTSENIP